MPEPTAGAIMARPKRVQTVEEKKPEPAIDTSAIERATKVVAVHKQIKQPPVLSSVKLSDLDILEQIGELLGPLPRKRRKQILAILERMA